MRRWIKWPVQRGANDGYDLGQRSPFGGFSGGRDRSHRVRMDEGISAIKGVEGRHQTFEIPTTGGTRPTP